MTLPEAVALILKALEEHRGQAAAPKFVDVDRCEIISGNAARQAHKRGDLKLFRVGKKLLARTADLEAWIEHHEVQRADPDLIDDVDAALAGGGVVRHLAPNQRLAGGAKR